MDQAFIRRIVDTKNIQAQNASKRLISTKLKQGPILQRTALGDVKNKNRTILNARRVLKKNEGTSNLTKITKDKKENVLQKPVVKAQKDQVHEDKIENIENTVPSDKDQSLGDDVDIESLSSAFSSNMLCVDDIDQEDAENPQLVSQYAQDIYKYLWSLEDKHPVEHKYLTGQAITYKMRGVLIDWLIQVHQKFSLIQETLYLTISILDRFLQAERSITKHKLQLVGITSMFIASKYEEMYIPEIADFAYITAQAFTTADIRKMEVFMLSTLNFYISFPLHLHFLRRNSKAGQVDGKQHTLAKYIMELTLPEYTFCAYKPSKVAAAALYVSLMLIGDKNCWTDTLAYYSKYSEKDVFSVVCQICALLIKASDCKQQTVQNKYKAVKYLSISVIPELRPTSKMLNLYASKITSVPKSVVKSTC